MYSYIKQKKTIKFSEIISNKFSLSSQQYKEILINKNTSKAIKDLLIEKPFSGKEVGSDSYVDKSNYIYIRTKGFGKKLYNIDLAINDSFSFIKPREFYKNVGDNNIREAKKGDILFATGGDLGNVTFVSKEIPHNIISSHIIKLNFGDLKYYCLAMLKTNLLKEQVSVAPSGGIKGLDTFSIDYLLNSRIPFPKYNSKNVIEYLSYLSEVNVILENALADKILEANEFIDKELRENQNNTIFKFNNPKISEIINIGRLDTLRYSKHHKSIKFLIENYKHGCSNLSDLGYCFNRGQNLQISNIGISIYSDKPKDNFYNLVFSKNFTKYCTYSCEEFLGNKLSLNKLKKGDIIFSSRGEYGRTTIILDDLRKTITNIDNIIIRNEKSSLEQDITICLVLNWYRENGFIKTIGFVGSGAESLTQGQIDSIPIPLFQPEIQNKIAAFYYGNYKISKLDKESINKLILNGGIKDIDDIRKKIRIKIDNVINSIIEEKEIITSLKI